MTTTAKPHDLFDRLTAIGVATTTIDHPPAFTVEEGEAHVEWFEGDFSAYEDDKKRRLGPDALEPKRLKYKKFTR